MKINLSISSGKNTYSINMTEDLPPEKIMVIIHAGVAILKEADGLTPVVKELESKQIVLTEKSSSDYNAKKHYNPPEKYPQYPAYSSYHTTPAWKPARKTDTSSNSEFDKLFALTSGKVRLKILHADNKFDAVDLIRKVLKSSYIDAEEIFTGKQEIPLLSIKDGFDLLKGFRDLDCFVSYKVVNV